MIWRELEISDFIFYGMDLMTDVFKTVFKYCRKIITKYRQMGIAFGENQFGGMIRLKFSVRNIKFLFRLR